MPRNVRVVTMGFQGARCGSIDGNRAMVLARLDRACSERPDLVCLPEEFPTIGLDPLGPAGTGIRSLAEPVPGPTTDAVAERARKHRTYIVCPVLRAHGGNFYNSAVLLDRRGSVAGIYDKVHPVLTESGKRPAFEAGVKPGRDYPVFETDFGRVGIQTCFDLGFIEGWQELSRNGAEIVVWVSAYDGGFHLQAMAFLFHYYVVSSVATHHACIINPLGEVMEKGGLYSPLAIGDIDLDFKVCHFDGHKERLKAIKARYGRDVVIRVLEEEGLFMIRSVRAGLSLSAILDEFPLESYDEYHERHRVAYSRAFRPLKRRRDA